MRDEQTLLRLLVSMETPIRFYPICTMARSPGPLGLPPGRCDTCHRLMR
jgi:hypothetical protein